MTKTRFVCCYGLESAGRARVKLGRLGRMRTETAVDSRILTNVVDNANPRGPQKAA